MTVTVDRELLRRLANTVRGLSIDGVQAANSGHPGLPLGTADFAVTLWYHFLRYNPDDPAWPGRDKFILSAGHGSMLVYSLMHLAGYDLPIEELKNFRQFGSKTPGHPENHLLPGIEMATGPLGQGFATAVGFAMADRLAAARVHRDGFQPFQSFVYTLCSDGDLMEGVAQEAASFAGHMKLGNLIYLYDDNDISLDGPTDLTFNREDTAKKYEAMGFQVQRVDGFDHQAVADAIVEAQKETERPSLIICKTVIGYGSPNKAGTSSAHGSPLGEEEVARTKEALGISPEKFHVAAEDREAWAKRKEENLVAYREWQAALEEAKGKHPDAVGLMETLREQKLPADLPAKLPVFEPTKEVPTRKAGEAVLKAIGAEAPWLIGGSADLSVSTNAIVDDQKVQPGAFDGRHLYFGVREHAMGAIVNGMTRQGFVRGFGATFLTFSDYMRGAVRLAALMECPSIFIYTHDSIFLGEDGPTHQPVEHVMSLRLIPNLNVFRPADAIETGECWVAALEETHGPSAIVLTRQNLPVYDRAMNEYAAIGSPRHGAYVFRPERQADRLDGILIGTGSELQLCVEAARRLEQDGKNIRVVSMPCWELFERQDGDYREKILPRAVTRRVAVEAGRSLGWERWVGANGACVSQDTFGASAPYKVLAEKFGFTAEAVVNAYRGLEG